MADDLDLLLLRVIRVGPAAALTLLMAYCTVRVALQGEWVGSATAAVLAVVGAFATVRRWRALDRGAAAEVDAV